MGKEKGPGGEGPRSKWSIVIEVVFGYHLHLHLHLHLHSHLRSSVSFHSGRASERRRFLQLLMNLVSSINLPYHFISSSLLSFSSSFFQSFFPYRLLSFIPSYPHNNSVPFTTHLSPIHTTHQQRASTSRSLAVCKSEKEQKPQRTEPNEGPKPKTKDRLIERMDEGRETEWL